MGKKGKERGTRSEKMVNVTNNLQYNELPGSNKTFRTTFSVCVALPYILMGLLCFFFLVSLRPSLNVFHIINNLIKVKQSRYRPGVAQRVPGS